MRTRNNPNAKNELNEENRFLSDKEKLQEILKKESNKDKKIYLEIGMGKGDFIINMALANNQINFYGLDKLPTVIYKAINKLNKF